IEDTALKTNLEAAEEVARQLRMRDLAGLIVIDFIDMEEKRNNRAVERKLKECLKHDRARIQVGGISHFGLLEMSRQRIRTSVLESSTEKCPACGGTGHVRSVASVALQLLRSLEETLIKSATHNLIVRTRAEVAIYVLNHKRAHLRSLEERFRVTLTITTDPSITGQISFAIDRGEQVHTVEAAKALLAAQPIPLIPLAEEEDEDEEFEEALEDESQVEAGEAQPEAARGEDGSPRRKRRRRRGRRSSGEPREAAGGEPQPATEGEAGEEEVFGEDGEQESAERSSLVGENGKPREGEPRRRRRGRRGGRRNRRDREGTANGEQRSEQESGVRQPYIMDSDIAEATPAPQMEPVEVPEMGAFGEDQRGGPAAVTAPPVPPAQPMAAVQPEQPPQPQQPKRRSTIREPAPSFSSGQGFAPPPRTEPTPSAAEPPASAADSADDPSKPRKTGWWAKRMFGDKG
ncbi:MAG: ribonuclease, partial [Alphaproteobacteria bacterium]|nr:ribonuclease [Alphaproteobacteria bacterium]